MWEVIPELAREREWVREGREGANMGCIREQVTVVGKWGSVSWGTVRRHKVQRCPTSGTRELGYLHTSSCQPLVGSSINSVTSLACPRCEQSRPRQSQIWDASTGTW